MATSTTSTPVSNASNAAFQTWVAEIITQFTDVGLTQTSDTGQINTGTVSAPAAAYTSQGYAIFKFNDSLQTDYPVFIRIDFGSASAATDPAMWVTVGTGSNGSGTINGTVMTKVAVSYNGSVVSTTNNYTSYFCYNSTYGFLALIWKQGAYSATYTGIPYGSFVIFRSNNSAGNSTGGSINLLSGSATSGSGWSTAYGYMQSISYGNSAVYPASSTYWTYWGSWPLSMTGGVSTSQGGVVQIGPVWYMTPQIQISAFLGLALTTDIPVGTTFSTALVGSTELTFAAVGFIATSSLGEDGPSPPSESCLVILWE
jgi:hypothetical protein